MARRAMECFRSQTYQNKRLYIYDTGLRPCTDSLPECFPGFNIVYHLGIGNGSTIGELRNRANWWAVRPSATSQPDADIILHMDDDDWSHPNRIEEQVALLQASGKQAVGYRDLLFWRRTMEHEEREHYALCSARREVCYLPGVLGEAWLYSNNDPRYCLGTSLCYWRSTWERRPFPDISRGEDKAWLREVESIGVPSFGEFSNIVRKRDHDGQPRMIASIHSGNHVVYEPEKHPHNWKRVPEWDQHCRETMAL